MTDEQLQQAQKMLDLKLTLKFVSNYYNTTERTLKKRLHDYNNNQTISRSIAAGRRSYQ